MAVWSARSNAQLFQIRHQVQWRLNRPIDTNPILSARSQAIATGPTTSRTATLTGWTDTVGATHSLAAYDQVRTYVASQARARAMATASNQYGTSVSFSGWSAWGTWSPTAQGPTHAHGTLIHDHPRDTDGHAHDLDADGDQASDGITDDIVGCPIPAPPTVTPTGPLCPSDPSRIAAVYPPGHSERFTDTNSNGSYDTAEPFRDIDDNGTWTADLAGVPTGHCFPLGHQCLPPPDGTGAPDELCLPRGS